MLCVKTRNGAECHAQTLGPARDGRRYIRGRQILLRPWLTAQAFTTMRYTRTAALSARQWTVLLSAFAMTGFATHEFL